MWLRIGIVGELFVNTVINLRTGNFLTNWTTFMHWTRTLLHWIS